VSDTISLTAAIGKVKGSNGTKENRVSKLLHRWSELESKFEGLLARGNGTTETARLSYACLVMMDTGIRVGNESSSEGFVCENKWHPDFGKVVQTFGLTTLQHRHVDPVYRTDGAMQGVCLSFTGKKLVGQNLVIRRQSLVTYCPGCGGDDDLWLNITYPQLYKFVKTRVGDCFSPKDIRATRVNQLFVERFMAGPHEAFMTATKKSDRKKVLNEVFDDVAGTIGHTRAVMKSAYLSTPLQRVLATYSSGVLTR
jgi:DNA topoisomerase IB